MVILLTIAALIGAYVGYRVLVCTFRGAVAILDTAMEQGFIGLAAYVACWVFLFPVMFVASFIAGLIVRPLEIETKRIA